MKNVCGVIVAFCAVAALSAGLSLGAFAEEKAEPAKAAEAKPAEPAKKTDEAKPDEPAKKTDEAKPDEAVKTGDEKSGADAILKTPAQKFSYCFGLQIGNSLKRQGIELDPEMLAKAIKDVVTGGKPLLTDAEAMQVMENFRKDMKAKQDDVNKKAGEKNKKDGDAFLADNAKKEGVKTLPSGLQYKVVKAGDGATPKAADTVTTNYRGTLIDGTEFDSSYKRGEPASFPVTGVIPGWTEALQLMKVGDKWQLFIPAKLGYGERGTGGPIGPNATLIFEIELLGIK